MLARRVITPAINTALRPKNFSDNPVTTLINLVDALGLAPDWVNVGSAGSSSATVTDSDDTPMGVGYIRSTSNATAGSQNAIRKTDFALDMTGKYWEIWVRVSDPSLITNCIIQATNDGFVNFSQWFIPIDLFKTGNKWYRIRMSWGDRSDTGTGVPRALFNTIQLKTTNAQNQVHTVDWGGLNAITERSQANISITFDDSYASAYNRARRKMDQYGYKGTAYIIPTNIGTSGRLTEEQLQKLQRSGWDISTHGSINLTTLTESEADLEVRTMKKWLVDRGFIGADHYAYPNGAFNYSLQENVIKKYFQSARSITEKHENIPPSDPYALTIWNVTDSDTVVSVTNKIDQAIASKSWLILVFHNIADTVTVPATEYSTANFNLIIDHLNSVGANVRTVSEALRLVND